MHEGTRRTLLIAAAAILAAGGTAVAQSQGSGAAGRGGNAGLTDPARGGGAIQPGTLEHTGKENAGSRQAEIAAGAPIDVSAVDIAQHPAQYFGKRVTFTTRVHQAVDPHFFTVRPLTQGPRAPDNKDTQGEQFDKQPVLVLIESPARTAPADGEVTISGTVRPFVTTDVQRQYTWFQNGWLEDASVDARSTTQPLIIADSVTTADGMQLVQSGATTGGVRAGDAPVNPRPSTNEHPSGAAPEGTH